MLTCPADGAGPPGWPYSLARGCKNAGRCIKGRPKQLVRPDGGEQASVVGCREPTSRGLTGPIEDKLAAGCPEVVLR